MEVGGLLALDEVEVQKLLQEVYSLSLLDIHMGFRLFFFLCVCFIFHISFFVLFLGARHVKEVSSLKEEDR